jgi:hypothetical protein
MSALALLILALMPASGALAAPNMQAGAARVDITPPGPIWMSGYASRTKPSEGVMMPISAKALAIQDTRGQRVVLVSTDLIGMPRTLTDWVSSEVMKRYKLDRTHIVFNSSHTHTGPIVRENLETMYNLDAANAKAADDYRKLLFDKLVEVIGLALGDMQPAVIEYGQTTAGFATNRREIAANGIRLGVNPKGPVDHSVPVLRVTAPNGKVRAILFGYACHNTTLTGEFYQISGDYAGHAQAEVERTLPGSVALFYELCGGDQNPNPRSSLDLAAQHGAALGRAVAAAVQGKMQPVSGRVKAAYQIVDLPLAPHTRQQYEQEAQDANVFKSRRAKHMLAAYDARREPRKVSLPVQAIRFERGFALIALGGEVVVDYALWAKSKWPSESLMVAGYSNDVPCYIPNARILREGGYEAVDSMIYYGQPGPFSEEVEERLKDGITQVFGRVMK